MRQQFTQKERDNETGLDYFGARYYASIQGRFTAADPINLTALRLYDPQRINLYNYCRGNPLKYLDSDGQEIELANARAHERIRANIDPALRENERKNIQIVGDKVVLVNRDAIDLSNASPAYQGLFRAITDNVTHRYFALAAGESAKPTGIVPDYPVFTYEQVHTYGGQTVPYDNGDTDSFVPVADDMSVEGTAGRRSTPA